MSKEPVVLYDSPEAASIQTVTGWVARTGEFWGQDEHMARWCGCTHKKCATEDCPALVPKNSFTICGACRAKKASAKFEAMPKAAWDGVGMLFSDACEEYFSDLDEAHDFAEDRGSSLAGLRLIICDANRLRPVYEDHWCDDLPEDGELPDAVALAVDALNKAIEEAGPVSWTPGKFALDLSTISWASDNAAGSDPSNPSHS